MGNAESPTLLSLKVLPSSSRDALGGWVGDSLKIKVQAAAERGRANQAVIRFLAAWLEIAPDQIRITSGQTSARKRVAIDHRDVAERTRVARKIAASQRPQR